MLEQVFRLKECHGPVKTPLLAPVKGLRDPVTMTVEQGGGGGEEEKDGDRRR